MMMKQLAFFANCCHEAPALPKLYELGILLDCEELLMSCKSDAPEQRAVLERLMLFFSKALKFP